MRALALVSFNDDWETPFWTDQGPEYMGKDKKSVHAWAEFGQEPNQAFQRTSSNETELCPAIEIL